MPERFKMFVTNKTGTRDYAEYSICIVSDNVTTPKKNTILREDPNAKAIPPDAYTQLVQQTFGITSDKIQDISAGNASILHHVFTQYSLR